MVAQSRVPMQRIQGYMYFFLNMGDLTYDDEYDDRNVPRMAFPSFTRKGGLNNIILYVPEVLFIFTQ